MARFVIPQSNHPQAINVKVYSIHYIPVKSASGFGYNYQTVATGAHTFTNEPVAFNIDINIQGSWMLWRKVNNRKNAAQNAANAWVKKHYDNVKLLAPMYFDAYHVSGIDYSALHESETWLEAARVLAYNIRYEKHLANSAVYMSVAPADFNDIPVYSELSRYEDDLDKAIGLCPCCGKKPTMVINHSGQFSVATVVCAFGPELNGLQSSSHHRWSKVLPAQFNPFHPAFSHPDAKQKLNDIYAGPKVQVPQQLQVATI